MRWRRLPLHLQIVFASSFVLVITLMVTTWWNVAQQRQQLIDDVTRQASGLAHMAALASRYMVIAQKLDELESMLISLAFYPDLMELAVMDKEAQILSDVQASENGPKVSFEQLQRTLPTQLQQDQGAGRLIIRTDQELVIWQPIQTSTLLGWVLLRIDLSRSSDQEQSILLDNLLAAIIVLFIDLLILFLILYLPGRSFRQAINFAQHLTECPGETLELNAGSLEVKNLVDALNASSFRLKLQRDELDRQHRELGNLNQHLEQRVGERTEELAESRKALVQLHQAVNQSSIAIIMLDSDFKITECNPAFQKMTGYESAHVYGTDLFELIWSDQNTNSLLGNIKGLLEQFESWVGEVIVHHSRGGEFWGRMVITPAKDEDQKIHFLLTLDDISDRKDYETQLIHQAHYDSLTNLPNRLLGMDRLNQSIRQGDRFREKTIVLYLDLDRFKQVNDTLGHHAGDLLLIETANRLTSSVRQYDTVCRLSGDEFLIILSSVDDAATVEAIAEKILDVIKMPFEIKGRALHVHASIGIAVIPDDGTDADEVLRYADTAMYQAKQSGRNCYKYYTQSMNDKAQEHLRIDTAMHTAIENNELEVYLQPVVDAFSHDFCGAEALMRWNSSSIGRVAPDKFISVAEENGLIVTMGQWILRESCMQAVNWPNNGFITVNVSSVQFRNREFISGVEEILTESGLAPQRLHLEITENVLMDDVEEVIFTIEKIIALGVVLVIDDFGTGYSSLSYLTRFRCSILKIDRSFVSRMLEEENSAVLVSAIIKMGHSLGMKIIAEGVETDLQLSILQGQGCDLIQGYYFSKPVPANELVEFINKTKKIN
ncbi:MAG TPA: EAL domain-containing protein [Gammaproteobacteria bacterium]|nr:EAL domain-containing protein [Gammaproteobacteria bacterium]